METAASWELGLGRHDARVRVTEPVMQPAPDRRPRAEMAVTGPHAESPATGHVPPHQQALARSLFMLAFSSSSANGGHISQRWAPAGDDTRGNPPGEWPPRPRPCSYVAWYPAAVLFGSGVFPRARSRGWRQLLALIPLAEGDRGHLGQRVLTAGGSRPRRLAGFSASRG